MISKITRLTSHGNERTQTVKKNILGSFAIKGISIIVQLLLVPLTLGFLNAELYGIWLTLSSIMLWLNFFDIGFTLGLKNKLAEAIAIKDFKRGKALVSTTYATMIAIFIPLCIFLEIIIPHINWSDFLNVSSQYNNELMQVISILVICFCLQMIFSIITTILASYQRVAMSSIFYVIGNALSVIVIFILTKTVTPSLTSLTLAISFIPTIVLIISSILLFKGKLKQVKPTWESVNKSLVQDIFSLGIKFFIIQIQMLVLYQSTNILISNLSSPIDVTSYNIAYKYISVATMLFSIVLSPLWPAFTDAYVKKDFSWMNNIYHKMTKIYLLSAIGIVIMILLSPVIYNIWIADKAFVPISMTIAVGVWSIINIWDSLQVSLINGIGAIKLQTFITIGGLICHIPLSLFLGKFFGAFGVIFSMTIINIIYSLLFTIQIHKLLSNTAKGIWIK